MKLTIRAAQATTALLLLAPGALAQLSNYSQDFEGLDIASPTALGDDGWLGFANVFDPMGGYLYGYGAFPAPNGGPGFSAIDSAVPGPMGGAQYVSIYSDYNNGAEHMAGNYIEANVFQEQSPSMADVGNVWTFSFDYLKSPFPNNGDGDTTTIAFIKVLKSSDGSFATLAFPTFDTTAVSDTVWGTHAIAVTIDPTWAGETLQFGFASTATNFNDSGRFYDNISFDGPPTMGPTLTTYKQDFESLDMSSPTALGDDGWIGFANVFDPMGGYLYGYGTFPAPNGGPGFSAIGTGDGGPFQGAQYINTYSDYNNGAEHMAGNIVNALVFQEQPVDVTNVGQTWRFSFDHRKNPVPNNGDGGTTTFAFVKVLKISDGSFATLIEERFDSTNVSDLAWGSMALDLFVDPSYVGELVQFGFTSFCTNFDDSGRYYDNICWDEVTDPGLGKVVCLGQPNSTGVSSLLTASGSDVAIANSLNLHVGDLPLNAMGYFVHANGGITVYNPGGSEGHLCIASFDIGRFAGDVLDSGMTGEVNFSPDLTMHPVPMGTIAVMAGDTRSYQYWTRDIDGMGGATSNFSSAVCITFQ